MKREEAISILEEAAEFLYQDDRPYSREAFDMAMEALQKDIERHERVIRASERHLNIVRCKDCFMHDECEARKCYGENGFCSVGARINEKYEDYEHATLVDIKEPLKKSADAAPKIDHDRDWIIGCIQHDGFIHTDRFDKANQIILDALADRPTEDKCDDCLYEDSDKSLFPCNYCKRNHFDKYEKDESNNITESPNKEYNDCDGHYLYYWEECSVCGARPPSAMPGFKEAADAYKEWLGEDIRGGDEE